MRIHMTVRVLSIAVALLLSVQPPAPAGTPVGRIAGALSLPSSCGIKASAGGCDAPTPGLYITTGAEFVQPCFVSSVEPVTANLCSINDHAGGAGRGAVVVHDPDGCAGATIELAADEPGDVYLDLIGFDQPGEPLSQWKIVGLTVAMANGAAEGLGYRFTIDAGSIDAANLADGSLLHLRIVGGEMKANVPCGVGSVSQFTITMQVRR